MCGTDDEPGIAASVSERARRWSTGADDADAIRKRVNDAITRLVAYQSASGSFGLWGPGSGRSLA
jgi:uncharacterized protein YfaS (alpha-2-macroglobulin family)